MKIIILGAGMVGGPIAIDLAKDKKFDVTAVDIRESNLSRLNGYSINKINADLSRTDIIKKIIEGQNLVVNAVPGFIGFETLRTAIDSEKDVVDITFYAEDPFLLDQLAKEKNVTAIVDCGVAPGLSNLIVGNLNYHLDETESIIIYVGGLPQKKEGLFEYKVVFSINDLLEEYIRPARYIENEKQVIKPALSECELIEFSDVGILEAFNSDGLRTIARTINAPNMKEKTLRYPGHAEKIAILREAGFFSKEEIEINGVKIRPFDLSAKILSEVFKFQQGDRDLTVLRVIMQGKKNGKKVKHTFEMLDRYDENTEMHSMARTTGYMATMCVRLLADGLYREKGITPPEFIGKDEECYEFIINGLRQRNIIVKEFKE